ncbi:lipopolysaccharide transport periplasmic protein LptA [Halomonas pacifica]|uniref:lipopolysaccharide transport periplasmic protein LptA n=1 Tax=Bisbaumannia pacifica TaxID=77098 RepID=UPI00235A4433|nr:lipopolysaccharide transport periplasmic protein LptA [Halomonas pacifica]MDC8803372.1 lipopolysaccharide transport periplasmic protein LptA [Halomonas pacifica]
MSDSPRQRLIGWLAAGLLGLTLTAPALAQQSEPIEVEADRLELDDRAGTAVYSGAVEIRQGNLQLTGARVEIQRNDAGEVSRLTATGERAYLEQTPADGERIQGWGRTIVYHAAERRVELIDRAELHRGADTFNGAYVEYLIDRRLVEARADAEGTERQRVRMTLTPEQQ